MPGRQFPEVGVTAVVRDVSGFQRGIAQMRSAVAGLTASLREQGAGATAAAAASAIAQQRQLAAIRAASVAGRRAAQDLAVEQIRAAQDAQRATVRAAQDRARAELASNNTIVAAQRAADNRVIASRRRSQDELNRQRRIAQDNFTAISRSIKDETDAVVTAMRLQSGAYTKGQKARMAAGAKLREQTNVAKRDAQDQITIARRAMEDQITIARREAQDRVRIQKRTAETILRNTRDAEAQRRLVTKRTLEDEIVTARRTAEDQIRQTKRLQEDQVAAIKAEATEQAILARAIAATTRQKANLAVSVGGLRSAFNSLSGSVLGLVGHLNAVGRRMMSFGSQISVLGFRLGFLSVPIGLAGGAIVSAGSKFESTLVKIVNLTDASADAVANWSRELLDLGPALGRTPNELLEGAFIITSAGLTDAEEATEALVSTAKAASIGLGNMADVARAVTAAVQSYAETGLTAAQATDILVATIDQGNLEADKLAPTMGRVTGLAAEMGISFDQLGAFVAAFTRSGVPAEVAITGLRGALTAILKPTKESLDTLESFGIGIQDVRRAIEERGLAQTLIALTTAFSGSDEALARFIPNVRGLSAVLFNTGSIAEDYLRIQQNIASSAGITDQAFENITNTLEFQWNRLRSAIEATSISISRSLLPPLKVATNLLVPMVQAIGALAELRGDIILIGGALLALAVALPPTLILTGLLITSIGTIVTTITGFVGVVLSAVFAVGKLVLGLAAIPVTIVSTIAGLGGLSGILTAIGAALPGLISSVALLVAGFVLIVVPLGAVVATLVTFLATLGAAAAVVNTMRALVGQFAGDFHEASREMVRGGEAAKTAAGTWTAAWDETITTGRGVLSSIDGVSRKLSDQTVLVRRLTAEQVQAFTESYGQMARVPELAFDEVHLITQEKTRQIAEDAEPWGANIILSLARGMASAISAVIRVLTSLAREISRRLAAHSPPEILPDLTNWGRAAMDAYLAGFTMADFDIFDSVASLLEDAIRSMDIDEALIVPEILEMREALAEALSLAAAGELIPEDLFSQITEALGGLGQEGGVQDLFSSYVNGLLDIADAARDVTEAESELAAATEAVEEAQAALNEVAEAYNAILDPLNTELAALQEQQDDLADSQEIARLQEIIDDIFAPEEAKIAAQRQIDIILLEDQIDGIEDQQEAAEAAAQAELEAAEAAEEAAREKLELAEEELAQLEEINALYERQIQSWIDTNNLIKEQSDLLESLKEEAESAAEGIAEGIAEAFTGFDFDFPGVEGGGDGGGLLESILGDPEKLAADIKAAFEDIPAQFETMVLEWEKVFKSADTKEIIATAAQIFVDEVFDAVFGEDSKLGEDLKTTAKDFFATVLTEGITQAALQLPEALWRAISNLAWDNPDMAASGIRSQEDFLLQRLFPSLFDDEVGGGGSGAGGPFEETGERAAEAVASGFNDGLENWQPETEGKWGWFWQTLEDFFDNFWQSQSPSMKMKDKAGDVIQGFLDGLGEKWPSLSALWESSFEALWTTVSQWFTGGGTTAEGAGVRQKFTDFLGEIPGLITSAFFGENTIFANWQNAWDALFDVVDSWWNGESGLGHLIDTAIDGITSAVLGFLENVRGWVAEAISLINSVGGALGLGGGEDEEETHHSGGYVFAPGGVGPGEFVFDAASVRRAGLDFFVALHQMLRQGSIPQTVAPPTVAQPLVTSPGMGMVSNEFNFGGNTINNSMDAALLEARIRRTVFNSIRR